MKIRIMLDYKEIRPNEISKEDEMVFENDYDRDNPLKINLLQMLSYIFSFIDWNDTNKRLFVVDSFNCVTAINVAGRFNEMHLLEHDKYMEIISFLNYTMEMIQRNYSPLIALEMFD